MNSGRDELPQCEFVQAFLRHKLEFATDRSSELEERAMNKSRRTLSAWCIMASIRGRPKWKFRVYE
jgi:hypothetical protein